MTRNVTAQVCDVNKSLMSMNKVLASGNRVIFEEEGSYIEIKRTGENMWLRDEGGMIMLKMYVKKSQLF